MKIWPLEVLLTLASREERAARVSLAAALAAQARRHAERTAAAAALTERRSAEASASRRFARGEGSTTAGTLADAARHLARLGDESQRCVRVLDVSEARIVEAQREADARRGALAAARAAAAGFEDLRERWRGADALRRERAQDSAVDELVSARPRATP